VRGLPVPGLCVKLIDDDYGIIRKFQGRSSLKTYLTTVVSNEMKDFLNHLLGKWRPSAEAQRLGPVAVQLEKLLRDGLSPNEAVRTLQTNHKVEMSAQELADMAARLPDRVPRKPMGEEVLQNKASNDRADSRASESSGTFSGVLPWATPTRRSTTGPHTHFRSVNFLALPLKCTFLAADRARAKGGSERSTAT
jgi:hypothetical protein